MMKFERKNYKLKRKMKYGKIQSNTSHESLGITMVNHNIRGKTQTTVTTFFAKVVNREEKQKIRCRMKIKIRFGR